MKYLQLFEEYSHKDLFKSYGYDVVRTLGSGKDGSAYLLSDGRVLKNYDNVVYLNDVDHIVSNLERAKGKDFKHLAKIFDYVYEEDDEVLFYITELLEENPITEYHDYTEYYLDFFGDFFTTYERMDFDFDKTVKKLFKSYTEVKDDEDAFNLDKYVDSVKDDLLSYYAALVMCVDEAIQNNFELDCVDDNIMFDPKTKTYKLIDYLG